MQRYLTEPYRFIPPHRSAFWSWVSKHLIPRHLRRAMGVMHWSFKGQERLRDSVRQGAGVLLAPNHCRWTDPSVVGMLGVSVDQYLFYVASYHLFLQSKAMGFFLNRIGGYSIWREGVDRESIRATAQILAKAERPVVLFPEGTWFRQNDRVGPLQEGLGLITRQAAKQCERPIFIHPVGIKYWLLTDPRPELARRVERLERRLGWQPQDHLELVPRLEKLGEGMLALKEVEYFGTAQTGNLDERMARLIEDRVVGLEKRYLNKQSDGSPLERIRRVRQLLVRRLLESAGNAELAEELRRALDDLLFSENLNAHSQAYLRERPTLERLTETVLRIEETVSDDVEVPVGRAGAVVSVGPAIDVRAMGHAPRGADPLVAQLRSAIQGLVDDLVADGPPPEWKCPVVPIGAEPMLATGAGGA